MHAKPIVAALLMSLLVGCSATTDHPSGQAPRATKTSTPVTAPTPDAMASAGLAAARNSAAGDLMINLVGDCVAKKDSQNALWLELELAVGWVGASLPATSYEVAVDRGGKPVRGRVTSSESFIVAIGGEPANGNAFLGRKVVVTLTVDPGDTVHEVREINNVATVVATFPNNVATGDVVPCE